MKKFYLSIMTISIITATTFTQELAQGKKTSADKILHENISKKTIPAKGDLAIEAFADQKLGSELNVTFVNTYTLMGGCMQGAKARSDIESKHISMANEIKKEEENIQQAVTEYKNKASMMSDAAKEKEEKRIMKLERDYKASVQDKKEELNIEMQMVTERLAKEVDEAIVQMAIENGYDVVFDTATGRAVYVSEKLDSTKQVLSSIDKKYEAKLAQEAATNKDFTVAQNKTAKNSIAS